MIALLPEEEVMTTTWMSPAQAARLQALLAALDDADITLDVAMAAEAALDEATDHDPMATVLFATEYKARMEATK